MNDTVAQAVRIVAYLNGRVRPNGDADPYLGFGSTKFQLLKWLLGATEALVVGRDEDATRYIEHAHKSVLAIRN